MDKNHTFDVYAQLILIGSDLQTGEHHVVSVCEGGNILPTCPWYRKSGPDLKSMIDKYVKLDMAWINPRMTGVRPAKDSLYVIFTGQIPLDTELDGAMWVSLEGIHNPDIRPSILEAARSI